jgi:hypothetical protein
MVHRRWRIKQNVQITVLNVQYIRITHAVESVKKKANVKMLAEL